MLAARVLLWRVSLNLVRGGCCKIHVEYSADIGGIFMTWLGNDEGTKQRGFPHAIVAGINRYPRRVTRSMNKKKVMQRSRIKTFVKHFNFQHLMPTRFVFSYTPHPRVLLRSAHASFSHQGWGKGREERMGVRSIGWGVKIKPPISFSFPLPHTFMLFTYTSLLFLLHTTTIRHIYLVFQTYP